MTVDILTPDATLFSGEASYVGLPGSDGSLGILNNHSPLVTTLKEGQVVVRTESGEKTFDVIGGSVEVLHNVVTVLAE
ncbi:MAG TPA: ATP synthase F1 subunit epsilon [Flavobacteriales bacterium]|nr:ATP synthase F1 subunit epsilon [Flavobacteriales bacterium]|tara:strand:+ start:19979 stop:20212 length:234 start_codon:yes stop_codon:yes gene_type:complete